MNNDLYHALGTTPFPNVLLDKVMPRLTDTSWRVLCVVVRQTFGFRNSDGTRKKTDWLSHWQLKQKTGRASSAISEAIDILVRSRLVVVTSSVGTELSTKHQRRQHRGHARFGLHPRVTETTFLDWPTDAEKRFPETINNKRKNNKKEQQHRQAHLDMNG